MSNRWLLTCVHSKIVFNNNNQQQQQPIKNIQVQGEDVKSDFKPDKTRQSLVCSFVCGPVCCSKAPPPQQPPPANKDCGPVCCSKAPLPRQPPPANKDCGPVCCSKAPPTTTSLLLLNGSYKQRLEPRVLFLPCTASENYYYYSYSYSSSCCCIAAAATTTSASTAWLLFCLYPMACKQRLRPRGCCDGGGLNNKGKKTKKSKNIQVQGQDVKSGCKPHKTRQILVCYTGLQSLSLPTTTTQNNNKQTTTNNKQQQQQQQHRTTTNNNNNNNNTEQQQTNNLQKTKKNNPTCSLLGGKAGGLGGNFLARRSTFRASGVWVVKDVWLVVEPTYLTIWKICDRQIGSWNPKFRGENSKNFELPPPRMYISFPPIIMVHWKMAQTFERSSSFFTCMMMGQRGTSFTGFTVLWCESKTEQSNRVLVRSTFDC